MSARAFDEMPALLEERVYWCRYENAFGDGWETRNAWRPEAELQISQLHVTA